MSKPVVQPIPTDATIIPGFPFYCITTTGIAYTCKARGSRKQNYCSAWTPLKQWIGTGGYYCIGLYRSPDLCERQFIHRLVLLAFVGECPPNQEVRHLNGIKTDNNLSNLAYGTKRENYLDSVEHGAACIGEKQPLSKLTNDQVREIRILASQGVRHKIIGEKFGVSGHYVAKICCREIWKHIH